MIVLILHILKMVKAYEIKNVRNVHLRLSCWLISFTLETYKGDDDRDVSRTGYRCEKTLE